MSRLSALFLSAAVLLPVSALAETVTVFAAASLKTTLDQIATDWQERTGHQVILSYAGSNLLAKQILAGAEADIFISAAEDWMDEVEKEGLIAPDQRRDLLGNRLVLIAHGKEVPPVEISPKLDLSALLGGDYLAMALVDAVPAGQYGKAALSQLGLWDSIAGQVAQLDNVRAALALVASGEAPYGIVYATDAAAEENVTVVGTFPEDSHPPIRYPAALLSSSKDAADSVFYQDLTGGEAAAIFRNAGFSTLQDAE